MVPGNEAPRDDRVPNPPLSSRILSGLAWTASANWGKAFLRLLILAVLARLISPHDFGVVGMALIVIGLTDVVGSIGVGPAIVQRQHLEERHISTAFIFSVLSSSAIGICIYFSSPLIASWFQEPELSSLIKTLSPLFPIRGIETVFLSLVQRRMNFRGYATIELFSYAIGYGIVGISLAAMGYGIWSLVVAQLCQATLYMASCIFTANYRLNLCFSATALRDLLTFGAALSTGRLGAYLADNGDYFVVGSWLGADSLGLYSRAFQITSNGVDLLATVIDRVLFPVIATIQDDQERLGRLYRKGLGVLAAIGLPLNVILVLIAPETVRIVLGLNWSTAILPYQIMVVAIYPRIAYRLSMTLAGGTGAVIGGAWRQWLYALSVITAAWLGHVYGIVGVSFAVTGAAIVHFLVMLIFAARISGVRLRQVAALHIRYMCVALLVGAGIVVVKGAGALWGLPDFIVVAFSGISAAATIFVLTRVSHDIFREEGQWIMSAVLAAVNRYNYKQK